MWSPQLLLHGFKHMVIVIICKSRRFLSMNVSFFFLYELFGGWYIAICFNKFSLSDIFDTLSVHKLVLTKHTPSNNNIHECDMYPKLTYKGMIAMADQDANDPARVINYCQINILLCKASNKDHLSLLHHLLFTSFPPHPFLHILVFVLIT